MFKKLSRLFIKVNRDSRVRLYRHGGFTGGLLGLPVDITLDKFSESEFSEIRSIINSLKCPVNLEFSDIVESSGFTVEVGSKNASAQGLKTLYNKGSFSRTPLIIIELEKKLKNGALPEDFSLKP